MIFQADLVLFTAIKAALNDMRKNQFLIDDAYSCLASDPLLKDLYGQREIENFRGFLNQEIPIYTQHRPPDKISFPCIEITIGDGREHNEKDALGDSFQKQLAPASSTRGVFQSNRILLGPVTPEFYDPLTGQITFGNDVDLTDSNIFDGQFVFDEVNKKSYLIQLVLDSKTLLIEENLDPVPNLTNMTIRPPSNNVGHIKKSIWVWETHTISVGATKSVEVIYLWTLLLYILGRYKKTLFEARNFEVSSINYGPIYKITTDDPNNLYGRDITITGRVEHSWIESTSTLIEGLSVPLRIASDDPPEGLGDLIEQQSWTTEGE